MEYHYIKVEVKDGVQVIVLNRPEVLNSFHLPMARELQDALSVSAADDNIRAVLLTGEGRGFCAGQDLAEVALDGSPDLGETVRAQYNPIIRAIRRLEKPVVCAVNGVAAGAGANMALACDIVIASEDASFIQSFSKIGLVPDTGGTFFLPRLVGHARATALMFLGEKVSATTALEWGMIHDVVPGTVLIDTALALARQLAAMPTRSFALTKRALNASWNNDLKSQVQVEEEMQRQAGRTADFSEGVRAFLEKRKPTYTGR